MPLVFFEIINTKLVWCMAKRQRTKTRRQTLKRIVSAIYQMEVQYIEQITICDKHVFRLLTGAAIMAI